MKIAFLNIYSGVNNRGAESFVHELILCLIKKEYQVDIFTGRQVGLPVVQPTHDLKNPLKRFFLDSASLSVLFFTLKLIPRFWQQQYDWLIPMNGFWQVVICKLITFFRGGRILITGHSGPGWDERWNLWLDPDVFVATTAPTALWAKKVSPWTRVETIPYGINIDAWKLASPSKINLRSPIILCAAAAVEYKRVDLVIKAVARLKKASLLYLGTGPLLPDLKKLGEQLLGERFLNLAVSYDQMPGLFAGCDVVTLPSSFQENSPMVFLEALSSGKIMVTTDAPRSRWILGQGGIFVDPTDTEAYASALRKALSIKDKKIIFSQAQKYSWDKIIGKYEKLLNEDPRQG